MKTKTHYLFLVLLLVIPAAAISQDDGADPAPSENQDSPEDIDSTTIDQAAAQAVVYSVKPLQTRKNVLTTFTITGANLPNTVTAWMENCTGLRFLSRTSTKQTYSCTFRERFLKDGVIYEAPGGRILYAFEVRVR
jgi:hypothetical protein